MELDRGDAPKKTHGGYVKEHMESEDAQDKIENQGVLWEKAVGLVTFATVSHTVIVAFCVISMPFTDDESPLLLSDFG